MYMVRNMLSPVLLQIMVIGAIASAFFVPESVQAGSSFIPCDGTTCSACDLVKMANIIITWLIGVVVVLFGVLVFIAGFNLVTSQGNPSALSDAKARFVNTIIGLLIILAAWLIVDTIMRGLGVQNMQRTGPLPWHQVQCQVQIGPETRMEAANANIPTSLPSNFTPGTGAGGLASSTVRSQLQAGGVRDGGRVISYEGLRPHAIEGVIAMNRECNCNITVTEATGGVHSRNGQYRHDNGYKIDIRTRDNPALVSWVQQNFQPAGQWSNGTQVYQRTTSLGVQRCAFESTHMDCQFIPPR